MTRPTVLVASTQATMAYALSQRLKPPCRELGLRLEICPEGEGEEGLGVVAYSCAENLFDALEKRDPMELADTLVVLDLWGDLEGAFKPEAAGGSAWHPSKQARAGVAVELLLRFPQVFPVFLSPATPLIPLPDTKSGDVVVMPEPPDTAEAGNWSGFHKLRADLCVTTLPEDQTKKQMEAKAQIAFKVPLHFVSPLDNGAGLLSAMGRFARGMRCWFDPTGLRTLVRNRFLGEMFGSQSAWKETWPEPESHSRLRAAMLDRLSRVAVAVDEEREFAMLSAYAAYKYGWRSWLVTSYGELSIEPLWNKTTHADMVMFRDIDLRFPDIPRQDKQHADKSIRQQLRSIFSPAWKALLPDFTRLTIRSISSAATIKQISRLNKCWYACRWSEDEFRLGERKIDDSRPRSEGQDGDDGEHQSKHLGLGKPLSFLHELAILLPTTDSPLICKIGAVKENHKREQDQSSGPGHGAPYLNLAMAESLLYQAKHSSGGPVSSLMGALLAGEAYQLLLGMSKTTALEALLCHHKKEVEAEVEFPGVSHAVNTKMREKEIKSTLVNIAGGKHETGRINMFLSQFWSEMKQVYRQGEQFHAAEEANSRSLVHGRWLPQWLAKWHPSFPIPNWIHQRILFLKQWAIVWPATTFTGWSLAFVLLTSIQGWLYYFYLPFSDPESSCMQQDFRFELSDSLPAILFSFLSQSLEKPYSVLFECTDVLGRGFVSMHLFISYVMLGVLVSMLFRKISRG